MDLRDRLASMTPQQRAKFIKSLGADELREVERQSESLLEFIPRVTPALEAPRHLQPLVDVFEAAERSSIRAVISTPPQHGKTQLALHALVRMIGRKPKKRHAYITYAADRSEAMSGVAQHIAENAQIPVTGTLKLWQTKSRGGGIWTGIGGPLTGFGVDGWMVVDDPVKNRAEAESSLLRDRTDQWFRDVALTRLHPGASVIVIATRWHVDDLSGRLIDRGWDRINLPALSPAGDALWPEKRPKDWLEKVKAEVGAYTWASLYQGEPRPRGGNQFGDVRFYKTLPTRGFRVAIGADCAYTKKKSSNWSVALVLVECEGLYYVGHVDRMQEKVPVFKQRLDALRELHPGAASRWYTSTTEAGLAEMIGIDPKLASEDKFVRAQPVAAAWNAGKVLLPESAPWLEDFVTEIVRFTGVNDATDDQVDALAAAFDELDQNKPIEDLSKYAGHKPRDLSAFRDSPESTWDRPDRRPDPDERRW